MLMSDRLLSFANILLGETMREESLVMYEQRYTGSKIIIL
jgi:hypothetical protein